jgi:hypothetical protein
LAGLNGYLQPDNTKTASSRSEPRSRDQLLTACGIGAAQWTTGSRCDRDADANTACDGFIAAIAKHRHFARETDPPRV